MRSAGWRLAFQVAACFLLAFALASPGAAADTGSPLRLSPMPPVIDHKPVLAFFFRPILQAGGSTECSTFRQPRLISATRGNLGLNRPAVIEVVVGTDGRIEDFLILDVPGAALLDRQVEQLLRRRVYEPALCNGSPVEAQGRIEISGR
jgi:hypothetical protein